MPDGVIFRFDGVPSKGFEGKTILEQSSKNPFMLIYDFGKNCTYLRLENENPSETVNSISKIINGLEFRMLPCTLDFGKTNFIMFYKQLESVGEGLFSDIFSIGIHSGTFGIAFIPLSLDGIKETKIKIERILGSIPNRLSSSLKGFLSASKGDSTSFQHEVFERSEESTILREALDQINFSIASNGTAYKIGLFYSVESAYAGRLENYLASKVLVLNSSELKVNSVDEITKQIRNASAIPFGHNLASALIKPYGYYESKYVINSRPVFSEYGIRLGYINYLSNSGPREVRIPQEFLNLGFIISGLPGTGKTSEAMNIILQLSNAEKRPYMVVIAPTSEWSDLGTSAGMNVIKICSDGIPINFFMPPEGVNIKRFYQDLAMLLASASEPGPYQKPLEKVLLNAFRRYYSSNSKINPVSLYNEILESIAELHGTRSNTGVKYTKHGENIKSSLESLIEILQFPEYSSTESTSIERLLENGLIFDVSAVGVQMKSFFYALILNQLYSIISKFDVKGDAELRILVCIEEAQLLFKDPKSATVADIRSRIQDFRKLGVGLMLMVHSITDIDQDIRRLCQSKIYLKQPTDVARKAAEDLIFSNVEDEEVVAKLKHLESGYGALNYIVLSNGIKINPDTMFIKTMGYSDMEQIRLKPSQSMVKQYNKFTKNKTYESKITLSFSDAKKLPAYARVCYLGTFIKELKITSNEITFNQELMKFHTYSVELLNDHKKVQKNVEFKSGRKIKIDL